LSQVFPAELGLETEQGLSVRGERSVSAVVTQRLNPTRIIGFAGFAAILAGNRRQPFGHADILINDFVAGAVEAQRAEFLLHLLHSESGIRQMEEGLKSQTLQDGGPTAVVVKAERRENSPGRACQPVPRRLFRDDPAKGIFFRS
jgi:hypothetical protein